MALASVKSFLRLGNISKLEHLRTLATAGGKATSRSSTGTTVVKGPDPGNVPGLSSAVLSVPSGEVGPRASKQADYKNPEYFCYNEFSYFEAEIEMSKFRIPQPSSVKKN